MRDWLKKSPAGNVILIKQKSIYEMKNILLSMIRLYRYMLSPFFPMSCRFTPTCSEYAMEAIRKYGSVTGLYLTARRLFRCHPFHPGGYDPVHPVRKNDSFQKSFSSPNPGSGFSNEVK